MDKSIFDAAIDAATPQMDDFCANNKYAIGTDDIKMVDVFPKWVRPIAANYSESKQFPVIYTFGAILGATASAVGKRLKTNFCEGSACIYPALWLVLVGKSGTGKSPAMQDFLMPVITKDNEGYEQKGKDHKKVIIDDATPAAVLRELRQGHGHTANWDEIVGKIEKSIKEVGYTDQLMSIRDHRSVNVDRRGGKDDDWADNHFVVNEPCLTICGTTQTDRWQRVFGAEQHLNSGFSHRFLFAYSDLNRDDSDEESPRSGKPIGNDMSMWADRLMSINQLTASPTDSIFLRFSGDADAYLSQFCRTELTEYKRMMLRGGIPTEGISKLKADILRLAMLFWALDWTEDNSIQPTITADQMTSACQSSLVFLKSFIQLYKSKTGCAIDSKTALRMDARRLFDSGMSKTDISKQLGISRPTLDAYLSQVSSGDLARMDAGNATASPDLWRQCLMDYQWLRQTADRFFGGDMVRCRCAMSYHYQMWTKDDTQHKGVGDAQNHYTNIFFSAYNSIKENEYGETVRGIDKFTYDYDTNRREYLRQDLDSICDVVFGCDWSDVEDTHLGMDIYGIVNGIIDKVTITHQYDDTINGILKWLNHPDRYISSFMPDETWSRFIHYLWERIISNGIEQEGNWDALKRNMEYTLSNSVNGLQGICDLLYCYGEDGECPDLSIVEKVLGNHRTGIHDAENVAEQLKCIGIDVTPLTDAIQVANGALSQVVQYYSSEQWQVLMDDMYKSSAENEDEEDEYEEDDEDNNEFNNEEEDE